MNKVYIVTYKQTDNQRLHFGLPAEEDLCVFTRTYKTKDEAYADIKLDARDYKKIVEQTADKIVACGINTKCVYTIRELEIEDA